MNTTTILSTTNMCMYMAFAKIQGYLFSNVILGLSCWCMTGPRAHILSIQRPAYGGEGYTIRDHDVKNQEFHAKMNIPEFF